MCERMRLSQDVLKKVFYLVKQILTQNTSLFFNRHIDQIILCSIYGVSKVYFFIRLPLSELEVAGFVFKLVKKSKKLIVINGKVQLDYLVLHLRH